MKQKYEVVMHMCGKVSTNEITDGADDAYNAAIDKFYEALSQAGFIAKMQVCDSESQEIEAFRCDNCDASWLREDWDGEVGEGKIKDLGHIPDLLQRLTPGGITPAGECPHCGALVFSVHE